MKIVMTLVMHQIKSLAVSSLFFDHSCTIVQSLCLMYRQSVTEVGKDTLAWDMKKQADGLWHTMHLTDNVAVIKLFEGISG